MDAASRDAVVSARAVIKDFHAGGTPSRVLHGVDLDLYAGELTLLVGPSGCGKTTLLSILTGILSLTGGTVSLFGTEISRLGDHEKTSFRRTAIGFVFQQYNLMPSLNAAENAALPLVVAGQSLKNATVRAAEILDRIGMHAHLEKMPSQLSGGQQQRVAIARALVHSPRFVVCDEPTAALDAQTGHTVMEILRDIALDAGRAVLVVTHDNRIFDFADRIVSMDDGRIDSIHMKGAST